MPRSEARLRRGIWTSMKGTAPHAKLLYAVILTEATLNPAGVCAKRIDLWADQAELSMAEAEKALADLCTPRGPVGDQFVVVDEATREVLVRTIIRRDGVAEQPNMLKAACAEALQVESPTLRRVLAAELRKLPPRPPDGTSKRGQRIVYPDPHGTADRLDPPTPPGDAIPTPSERVSEPFRNPSGTHTENPSGTLPEPTDLSPDREGFPMGSRARARGGRGRGRGSSYLQENSHTGLFLSTIAEATADEQAHPEPASEASPNPPRPDVEALCERLRDRIAANDLKPPTITDTWRREARLMLDRDGRDEDQASRLIDWCQADPFWHTNILSMAKFRKQYDQLLAKARTEQRRGRGRQRTSPTAAAAETTRAALARHQPGNVHRLPYAGGT